MNKLRLRLVNCSVKVIFFCQYVKESCKFKKVRQSLNTKIVLNFFFFNSEVGQEWENAKTCTYIELDLAVTIAKISKKLTFSIFKWISDFSFKLIFRVRSIVFEILINKNKNFSIGLEVDLLNTLPLPLKHPKKNKNLFVKISFCNM